MRAQCTGSRSRRFPRRSASRRPTRCRSGPRRTVRNPSRRPTLRRLRGNLAETIAAHHLRELGWEILGSQVAVHRDEIDIVAVEPGDPGHRQAGGTLVFVEVRSHTTTRFGTPEESIDQRKVGRLYRAAFALSRIGRLPDGTPLPRVQWRVDVLAVDVRPSLAAGIGGPEIRHIRAVTQD